MILDEECLQLSNECKQFLEALSPETGEERDTSQRIEKLTEKNLNDFFLKFGEAMSMNE